MRKLTEYDWHTGKLTRPMNLLVVSDLHDEPYKDIFSYYSRADAVLVPGDVVNRYEQSGNTGLRFLRDSAIRLPTFFSYGNHEYRLKDYPRFARKAKASGAKILHNRYVRFGELVIGGWYRPKGSVADSKPDFLPRMEREDGCKILLCHKPEDYIKRLGGANIDLAVSGHAHGGQVRILGRGLYAPGQGLLPRYTHGVVGNMIISAGASNVVRVPRWGNPCEVVLIHLD